jgi:predicted enzyme related to lactoylglutathione lyase
MMFIQVPEAKEAKEAKEGNVAKVAKNRVHVDLGADDLDAEVDRVLGLGAELVGRYDEWGATWATFRDPEGNEFCVGLHPQAGPA